MYLELGLVPIFFRIKAKRIMYLNYLLHCKEEDMIKKVLRAQQRCPATGDWVLVVQEDLQELDLHHISWDEIETMSKENLKQLSKKL